MQAPIPHAEARRIAVTGASGFIGRHLVAALRAGGHDTVPLVRKAAGLVEERVVDLASEGAATAVLAGVEVLVHCAGYAHAQPRTPAEDERLHRLVNCELAEATARAALRAGVCRFVFLSSVKAMGDPGGACVDERYAALPDTPYGRAKRAAEEALRRLSASSMELVVVRPAMVYGPGSRGNLERMFRLVAGGRFPPLPATGNRRSMVHVTDLVDAIIRAALVPAAAGRTYIVAHPRAVSGRELYESMCRASGRAPSRWSVPAPLLRLAGIAGDAARRLGLPAPLTGQAVSSLLDWACYASVAIRDDLGWEPRIDIDAGIRELALEQDRAC
jgi:nucleoside-diphosphate-sugar epimerase